MSWIPELTRSSLAGTYTNIQEDPAGSIFRIPLLESAYNTDSIDHDNNNYNCNNNNVQETNCMGTQKIPDSAPDCSHVLHELY